MKGEHIRGKKQLYFLKKQHDVDSHIINVEKQKEVMLDKLAEEAREKHEYR